MARGWGIINAELALTASLAPQWKRIKCSYLMSEILSKGLVLGLVEGGPLIYLSGRLKTVDSPRSKLGLSEVVVKLGLLL